MSSVLQDNSLLTRTFLVTATLITALAIKYPNCAVFDENRKGIAYRNGWPIVGNLPKILVNSEKLHEFLLSGFTILNSLTTTTSAFCVPRSIATIDPRNIEHILKYNFVNYVKGPQLNEATSDLLGHGIFNANGEKWKYQRKTASHIFNVQNFRDHFTEVFIKELNIMAKVTLDPAIEVREAIDFHDIMFKFTLDSFVLLGFGVELNVLASKGKIPFAASFDECQRYSFKRFVNPFWKFTEPVVSLIYPWRKTFKQHIQTIDGFATKVIEQRRKEISAGETTHKDLLSRFMNSCNEVDEPLNDKELRDVVLNLVIAGRDTTAQALSWSFYMMLLHPRVEAKLLLEIDEKISDDLMSNSSQLYEVIKNMTYAHAIFYEVLRLFPSVPNNQKYALDDDIWPDGTSIKKGDYVLWCPWAQGRSESIWGPDAKDFKPERWICPEGKLRRETQGRWAAFNAGPRVCLGQTLATLEALVTMIYISKRYKLVLLPDQNITYQASLTLPMKEGMKVFVEKR